MAARRGRAGRDVATGCAFCVHGEQHGTAGGRSGGMLPRDARFVCTGSNMGPPVRVGRDVATRCAICVHGEQHGPPAAVGLNWMLPRDARFVCTGSNMGPPAAGRAGCCYRMRVLCARRATWARRRPVGRDVATRCAICVHGEQHGRPPRSGWDVATRCAICVHGEQHGAAGGRSGGMLPPGARFVCTGSNMGPPAAGRAGCCHRMRVLCARGATWPPAAVGLGCCQAATAAGSPPDPLR